MAGTPFDIDREPGRKAAGRALIHTRMGALTRVQDPDPGSRGQGGTESLQPVAVTELATLIH